jgi:hypothetical protein
VVDAARGGDGSGVTWGVAGDVVVGPATEAAVDGVAAGAEAVGGVGVGGVVALAVGDGGGGRAVAEGIVVADETAADGDGAPGGAVAMSTARGAAIARSSGKDPAGVGVGKPGVKEQPAISTVRQPATGGTKHTRHMAPRILA